MGIMDKVVTGFNKGVSSVSEGSKTFVEKARINTKIEELEREKTRYMQNIGNLVYNLQSSGAVSIPQCEAICGEVAECDRQIEELKQQREALEQQRYQNQQYAQQQAPMDYNAGVRCSCGFINRETAKFCASCGSALNSQANAPVDYQSGTPTDY